ncbi:MAG: tetratricopeptide repeat protein, partial [bacterium]
NNAQALALRGYALGLMGEDEGLGGDISGFRKGAEAYLKAAQFHGDQGVLALLGAANCYLFLQRYKESLDCVERLFKEYPNLDEGIAIEAEWIKVKCYIGLNYSREDVISQCQKIIEKHPNTRTAAASYLQIMELRLRGGDEAQAAKELEEIIKRYKKDYPNIVSMALSRWGTFFFAAGDYEKAIKYYGRVVEEVPQYGDLALIRVGECYRMLRQYGKAVEAFQQVLERYPHSKKCARALLLLGQTFYQMGKKEEAVKVFQEIIEHHPDSPEVEQAKNWIEFCKG